ncbi:A disintegrin and metalloproteinase with thrombospondin motifs 12-like [Asterias rubens]|uniref:A disintegrin and metalloproteinase with thrombospondin motifs 12-like n=1 Tax=Asterias rubens TaxID=7604 RepID=UPI0014556F6A|nr:A disintegrin and metalloproteinase with thrombospondin motifs 12-like [Asterias rubens]
MFVCLSRKMLPTCYLLLMVLCICRTMPTKNNFKFNHPKQAEFLETLEDYEIVIPSLVDNSGEFISHDVNLKHTPENRQINGDEDPVATRHYRIILLDKDLHLQLVRSHRLIAPGFILERRGRNISESSMRKVDHAHHCHFNGHVRGHRDSKVAVSTCDGVVGMIRLTDEEFFIEPIRNYTKSQSSDRHPHVVYKRSALPPDKGRDGSPRLARRDTTVTGDQDDFCGVNDKVSEEQPNISTKKAKLGKPDVDGSRSRRRRRSTSKERNVELLVVVDKHMVQYYKDQDIETYVLTIMNIVAAIYHDVTIGNYINIVMVRLLFLEDDEEGLSIEHDADKTLSSFCRWQQTINPGDDTHPNHHDAAVLLTRKDLCKGFDAPCGTLGLAQVSGMCQREWSCNINEDTGLALAYTVAHELGHSFGMQHDGLDNSCTKTNDSQIHVMSSQLTGVYGALTWSPCSSNYVTRFLDQGFGDCLNDEPTQHDFNFPLVPPGVMYTAEHQCRLQYGVNASVCSLLEPDQCSTLWCKSGSHCHSKLSAAAPGTSCGRDKWCRDGECVDIKDSPRPIHGDWGPWSEWSACSFSCGGGVAIKERHCDNPRPTNGGRYCVGVRKKYAICNRQDCPEGSPTPREAQCNSYNGLAHQGNYFHWIPYYKENALCELHCRPLQKNFMLPIKFSTMVKDGTPCTDDSRDICIGGICYTVGCDLQINSHAVEDRCGVCHGDGSSCETVKDQLIKQSGFGYVEAMVIPRGARNIRVEEVAESTNFLALMDPSGHYYLNGGWDIKWSGKYEAAGTVVRYERDDQNKETFEAKGPLEEPLHVMLLFQSKTAGVAYEYTVPKPGNTTVTIPKQFHWQISGWSPCTATCGSGLQRMTIFCVERVAGMVDDKYCNGTKPNDEQRQCNVHQCPANWWIGPWQHCSVTCGLGGSRSRSVFCIRSLGQDEQVALVDEQCVRLGLVKPRTTESCRVEKKCPLEANWITGEWSECLFISGRAEQTRTVHCSRTDTFCDYASRPTTRQPCDLYEYSYDYYGDYSVKRDETPISFGEWERLKEKGLLEPVNGHTMTTIGPIGRPSNVVANQVPDSLARGYIPPPDTTDESLIGLARGDVILEIANQQVDPDGDWVEPIKPGHVTGISKVADELPEGNGDSPVREPPRVEGQTLWWVPTPWSECSVSCGDGVKHRTVECLEVKTGLHHRGCDQTTKPLLTQSCHNAECKDSNALSNSCDGNKQTNTWCRLVLVMGNCGKYPYNDLCCETCIAYAAPYNV